MSGEARRVKRGEDMKWMYCLAALAAIPCAWATDLHSLALAGAYVGFFAAWTVGLTLVYILAIWVLGLTVDLDEPVPEDHPVYRWIVLTIIGLLCRVGRLRIHLRGLENVPEEPFLLVGNHRSGYDPIATVWALRRAGVDVAFITKPENMKIPLVPVIHLANFLVIDREDPRKAVVTIRAAAELLKNRVVNVGVYPEGTRSKTGQMLPFHDAVFKIAQRGGAPIVVAAISGTEHIWDNLPWRRTDVTIDLCACIGAEEAKASTTKVLGEKVRAILDQALEGK